MTEEERLQKYGVPMPADHWIVTNWQKGLKPGKMHTSLCPTMECKLAFKAEVAWR